MGRKKADKKAPNYYLVSDKPAYITPVFERRLQAHGLRYQGTLMPIGSVPLSQHTKEKLYYHAFSSESLIPLLPDGANTAEEAYITLICIPVMGTGTLKARLACEGVTARNVTSCQPETLDHLVRVLEQNALMLFEDETKIKQTMIEVMTKDKSVISVHVIESTSTTSPQGIHEMLSFP